MRNELKPCTKLWRSLKRAIFETLWPFFLKLSVNIFIYIDQNHLFEAIDVIKIPCERILCFLEHSPLWPAYELSIARRCHNH